MYDFIKIASKEVGEISLKRIPLRTQTKLIGRHLSKNVRSRVIGKYYRPRAENT